MPLHQLTSSRNDGEAGISGTQKATATARSFMLSPPQRALRCNPLGAGSEPVLGRALRATRGRKSAPAGMTQRWGVIGALTPNAVAP
jgi:hypothetical protein